MSFVSLLGLVQGAGRLHLAEFAAFTISDRSGDKSVGRMMASVKPQAWQDGVLRRECCEDVVISPTFATIDGAEPC